MVSEETDGDDLVNHKKAAHQQGAAWRMPSTSKQPQPKRQLPAFNVWQAGQLFGRDVMFGSFLLLTFFLYLRSTVPELCNVGPPPPNSGSTWKSSGSGSAPALPPDEWPFAFRLVCGHVQVSLGTWNSQRLKSGFSSYLGLNSVVVSSVNGSSTGSLVTKAAYSAALVPTGLQRGISSLLSGLLDLLVMLCAVLGLNVLKALVYISQGVFTFFACGFLTGDPFHVVIPPLRLALVMLLLLPLPLPSLAAWRAPSTAKQQQPEDSSRGSRNKSSSKADSIGARQATSCSDSSKKHSSSSHIIWYRPSYWWQHPQFRAAVIILQRLLPPATAALSVGGVGARFFDLTALRYWPLLGQYAYLGWTAWMLVVPLKVHVVVNITEWLLVYSTAVRVRMVHYNSPLVCTTHLLHLLASLMLVLLLPTAGVAWLERGHRARYKQAKALLQQQPTGHAAACDKQQQYNSHQHGDVKKAQCQVGNGGTKEEPAATEKQLKHSSLLRRRQQQHVTEQDQQHCLATTLSAAVAARDHLTGHQPSAGACNSQASSSRRHHARTCSVPAITSVSSLAVNNSSTSNSVGSNGSNSALGDQLLAEISSSLQLAAAWAAKQQAGGNIITRSGGNGADVSNSNTKVPFSIDHLIKQSKKAAAAQPAAAAAAMAASTTTQPAQCQHYTSLHRAASLPPSSADSHGSASRNPSAGSSASAGVQTDTAAACSGLFVVPELAPAIKSLIGDQQAAAVFAAAAASASAQVEGRPQPGMVPYYTSRAPRQGWSVGLQLA